jgi:hypothetical protein
VIGSSREGKADLAPSLRYRSPKYKNKGLRNLKLCYNKFEKLFFYFMHRRKILGMFAGLAARELMAFETTEESVKIERTTMNLDQAAAFAREAVSTIAHERTNEQLLSGETSCIDGRWQNNENGTVPECSIPGADEGLIQNILAAVNSLGLENPEKAKIVALEKLFALKGGIKNLRFHTDEHAEHAHDGDFKDIAKGCGHFNNTAKNPQAYGLNNQDVYLISQVLEAAAKAGARREILKGEHKETAVILIEDETLALKHQTSTGQAFVYNQALHNKILKALALELSPILGVDNHHMETSLISTNKMQTDTSVKLLAKGLNLYSLKKGTKGLVIKFSGVVNLFFFTIFHLFDFI